MEQARSSPALRSPVSRLAGRLLIAVSLVVMPGLCACVHYQPSPLSPPAGLESFEARTLDAPDLGRFLMANHQVTVWPPAAWDLPALTLVAFYYHADLDQARAAWATARAGRVSAGERPNPNISVAPGYNSTTPASEMTPWILTLDLDFTIETAGKRGHRLAQAQAVTEAARLNIATAAWQVRSRVRRALIDLHAATATAALLEHQQQIQEGNLALIDRQLAAGAISSFERIQARLVLDTIRLAAHEAARQQAESRVTLAAALGVTVRALDGVALDVDSFARTPAYVPTADARRQALVNRPDILGALAEYEARQSALQLEIARQYPDIHLGPGYQMDQAANKWTLGLASLLPAFSRNRGPIGEAAARRGEAAAAFAAVQSRAIEEIDRGLAAYRGALATLAAAEGLQDDLRKQELSAEAQLRAGETSKLDLGTLQFELATAELARLAARVKAHQALGSLEDALQIPADAGEWLQSSPRPRDPGVLRDQNEPTARPSGVRRR
jgi:outer membrane protein, heavy metal efflux system